MWLTPQTEGHLSDQEIQAASDICGNNPYPSGHLLIQLIKLQSLFIY